MEQHEHDEHTRNSQLLSRAEVIKAIKSAFCQENAKLKFRPEEDQKLLGNFMVVIEPALLQDVKALEIKATDLNSNSAQMLELYAVTGCVSVFQLIQLFQKLQSQEEI